MQKNPSAEETQFIDSDMNTSILTFSLDASRGQMSLHLNDFLQSKAWEENIALWEKSGICYLSDEHQEPPTKQVGIFIKKDEMGLPIYLKVSMRAPLTSPSYDCSQDEFFKLGHRINIQQLSYLLSLQSIMDENKYSAPPSESAHENLKFMLKASFKIGRPTSPFLLDDANGTGMGKLHSSSSPLFTMFGTGHTKIHFGLNPASAHFARYFNDSMGNSKQNRTEIGLKEITTPSKPVLPDLAHNRSSAKIPSTKKLLTWSRATPIRSLAIGAAALLIGSTVYGLRNNTLK